MNKQPEITAKTRQKIMDSFWQLYFGYGIDNVTVSKVMKTAQMNRGTFYQYFTDIYDLLEQLEEEFIDQLMFGIMSNLKGKIPFNFDVEILSKISAALIEPQQDTLCFLISDKGDPAFAEKLKSKFLPIVFAENNLPSSLTQNEYLISAIFYSVINTYKLWYQNGKKEPLQELMKAIQTFIKNGVLGFV